MNILFEPWAWYITGPVIGLTVPILLLLGNKRLGISSTLRQVCAACLPSDIPLFRYNWREDIWNLFLVAGVLIGGFIGGTLFANPDPVAISQATTDRLQAWGVRDFSGMMPGELFAWSALASTKGILLMLAGGFMVGFGTRYARGCTSGHGILGLSALQWPSLLATASFFLGGIVFSYFVLPYIFGQ